MTEFQAADLVNKSDFIRCLNCKADLPLGSAYWLVTPFPYIKDEEEWVSSEELIAIALLIKESS